MLAITHLVNIIRTAFYLTTVISRFASARFTYKTLKSDGQRVTYVCGPKKNIVSALFKYKKVKYPRYRPTWPRGVQEVKAPRFHDTRHMKVVRSLPLRTGRLYPQEYSGTHS